MCPGHSAYTPRGQPSRHGKQPALPLVLALVIGRLEQARLFNALAPIARIRFVARIGDVAPALEARAGHPADVIGVFIAESRDADDTPTGPLLSSLTRSRPELSLIGYCGTAIDRGRDALEFALAGVHELIHRDFDDHRHALRAALVGAHRTRGAQVVMERIASCLPDELYPFAEFCLFYPTHDHSVEGLANALGVNRKTLLNQCARAGVPAPSALAAWCRLLLSIHLLASIGGKVEQVTQALNYPSSSALRNMFQRYLGRRPGDFRGPDGFDRAFAAFAAAIASCGGGHSRGKDSTADG